MVSGEAILIHGDVAGRTIQRHFLPYPWPGGRLWRTLVTRRIRRGIEHEQTDGGPRAQRT
jgi:hypothetical protein